MTHRALLQTDSVTIRWTSNLAKLTAWNNSLKVHIDRGDEDDIVVEVFDVFELCLNAYVCLYKV